ncbi:hypothetical protein [Actinopolymorpha sp. B9G3]|uniref:hypothetical protein n=1 Tax=Actinopolymorpha sp. B9G3 TaxID=3158970 RepID=UPI0032D91CE2
MRPRHERLTRLPASLGGDHRTTLGDVVPHRRVRQPRRGVLVHQPGQHSTRGTPLLPRRVQILAQHLLGFRTKEASWRTGGRGERLVGRTLWRARLLGWRTLHAIPIVSTELTSTTS